MIVSTVGPASAGHWLAVECLSLLGYQPLDPACGIRNGLTSLTSADTICVLPGWQSDADSGLLVQTAMKLKLPVQCLSGDDGLSGRLIPRVRAINLSGYPQVGKDAVADILTARGWTRYAAVDVINDALRRLDPIVSAGSLLLSEAMRAFPDEHQYSHGAWESMKNDYRAVRGLQQRMGAEVGHDMFGETAWTDYLLRSIPDRTLAVFPGCRFPADAVATGGQTWRIERPGHGPVNGHISETAMDDYDFDSVIHNDGDLEELTRKVEHLLESTFGQTTTTTSNPATEAA